MPLYEYRCNNCHRRVTVLIRDVSKSPVTCPSCGGTELKRLFSSFSVRKSDKAVYDDILSDSQLTKGLLRNDPRALAEWNKKMSQGTDEDIAPEYDEMLDRMAAGEMPDDSMRGEKTSEEQS